MVLSPSARLHAPQSLKGVSGDVIILEEAVRAGIPRGQNRYVNEPRVRLWQAYCDPGLVAEVVVPLLRY